MQNENLREEIGSVLSPYFIIDNNPPQLTSIQINDGGGYAITPFLSVTVGVTDIHEIYISLTEIPLADSCADYEDLSGVPLNPNWRKWDNDVAGMSLSFQVTPDDGGKKTCAWARMDTVEWQQLLASTVVLESRYIPILSQFEVYQNTPGKLTAAAVKL